MGEFLAAATGKGLGEQSFASGGYEAYEHAAILYRLPRQRPVAFTATLEAAPFEVRDRLYAYARHIRTGRPQPVLLLSAIDSIPGFSPGRPTPYPQIAADTATPLTADLVDLAPLARYATSSGYASGNTAEDALLHAVNELVERDAISGYLLTSVTSPKPLQEIVAGPADPLFDLIEEIVEANGAKVHVVRLPSVVGTVVMAYQVPRETAPASVGAGCSADPRIAFERAVTELQQDVAANDLGVTWADEGGVSIDNLSATPRLHQAAKMPRPEIGSRVTYAEFVASATVDGPYDLVPSLRSANYAVLWREVWSHRAGQATVYVVQVVIPGLERFDSICFGRPMLPAGRLWSPATSAQLLEGQPHV